MKRLVFIFSFFFSFSCPGQFETNNANYLSEDTTNISRWEIEFKVGVIGRSFSPTSSLSNGNHSARGEQFAIGYRFKSGLVLNLYSEAIRIGENEISTNEFGQFNGSSYLLDRKAGAVKWNNVKLGIGYSVPIGKITTETKLSLGYPVFVDANGNYELYKLNNSNLTIEHYSIQQSNYSYTSNVMLDWSTYIKFKISDLTFLYLFGSISFQKMSLKYDQRTLVTGNPIVITSRSIDLDLSNYYFGTGIQVKIPKRPFQLFF